MTYQKFNSYHVAKKTEHNGLSYDSKFEAGYAEELDLMLMAKTILGWERQVNLDLVVNGYVVCQYRIDFVVHHIDGTLEYVECKGYPTPVWILKWKLFEALYSARDDVKLTVVQQGSRFKVPKARKYKKV